MSRNPHAAESSTKRTVVPTGRAYEICVRGRLGSRWAAWFGGMQLTNGGDGTTVIRGSVADQAALHGLLQTLRDLGIELLSLTAVEPEPAPDHDTTTPGAHT